MFDFFDELFDFNFFFGGGRGRGPDAPEPDQGRRTGGGRPFVLFALPVPIPPVIPEPVPVFRTPPFIPGPAANDPVFRVPKTPIGVAALGRLIGLGGLVISAADILVKVISQKQLEGLGDIIRDQDRQIADINIEAILERLSRERALRVEKKVAALLGAPETFELPQPAPRPQTVPGATPGIVAPETVPVEIPFPNVGPLPGPLTPTFPELEPQPSAPGLPVPTPTGFPFPVPLQIPSISPLPFSSPSFSPLTVGDPGLVRSELPGTASQFQVGTLELPIVSPAAQADPARCRARKCDDDLEFDRTECFKGLYRESLRSTGFTQWVQIDCITGREV